MLKYLYSNLNNEILIKSISEQKIINEIYNNKFYIRCPGDDITETLILDNNSNFFLLNKKNIKKHLLFFKNTDILCQSVQLKEFIYIKKSYWKIRFYIKKKRDTNFLSYIKLLFLLQKNAKNHIFTVWPLLLVKRSRFHFILNGLRGSIQRKYFIKTRGIFKKLWRVLKINQKYLIFLKIFKKMILKILNH